MTSRATALSVTEESLRTLSGAQNEPEWLLERRLEAYRTYEETPMPDPRAEEWRRTDISFIDFDEALSQAGEPSVELISQDLPAGVIFADLATAAREHESLVKEYLHSVVAADEWKLGALEAAAWSHGALLYIPRSVEVKSPVRFVLRQNGAPAFPHLLVIAEANSSVSLIQESTGGASSGWSLVSGAVELICKADSRVSYLDLQNLGMEKAVTFSTVRAKIERGAQVTATLIGLGGKVAKTKLDASLVGEGGRAVLIGLSLGGENQHFDYQTLQDHLAPRTSSDLLFKAALDDASSNVWYGKVRIHKGASQSEAAQSSRNLLLSNHAKAAPIPVLEIEAFDILRCSHGATAGPVDPEQLFYLESRGIPPEQAERLLIEAFFQEVVDRVPDETFRDRLMQDITKKIGAAG